MSFMFVVVFINLAFSQVSPCGIHDMEQEAIEEDPSILERRAILQEFTEEYIQRKTRSEEVYVIPVVMHIMHSYGEENISREQVEDAIRIMNEDFRKDNWDTTIIIPQFQGIAADSRIEFRLAKLDPEGNCTDGITRTFTNLSYSAGENVKPLSRWPRDMYLNIWVVGGVASGAAGYSYYPGIGPNRDGIVVRHDYVGGIGTSSLNRARTLTHEAGHYLNLAHPWGSSNEPAVLSNCGIDDEVSDTPETIGSNSCNLSQSSCGSLDNVQNFMEYSYCTRMFTQGQKDRMRAALNSNVGQRVELWQIQNLMATGTNDGYQALPCVPVADFSLNFPLVCEGTEVTFTDNSYNAIPGTWLWSFPGGTPATSNQQNPSIYYETAGTYSASLFVGNQVGDSVITKESIIHIVPGDSLATIPFFEGFESPNFPAYEQQGSDLNWLRVGDGVANWKRTLTSSASGMASAKLSLVSNEKGSVSSLISPPIYVDPNMSDVYLNFKYAYAQNRDEPDDEFNIYISNNCGESWSIRFTKSGYFLSSTGGVEYNEQFLPQADEWKQIEKNISIFTNTSEVIMIQFECVSDKGNDIYLDDIEVVGILASEDQMKENSVSIYPNPITAESQINIRSVRNTSYLFRLTDIQGKLIGIKEINLTSGENIIPLQNLYPQLKKGVYMLQVMSEETSSNFKIIKMND